MRDQKLCYGFMAFSYEFTSKAVLKAKLASMTRAVRVCAAFPGLIRHAKQNNIALENITTTAPHMRDEGIIPHPEDRQWANDIDALLEGSTRWQLVWKSTS